MLENGQKNLSVFRIIFDNCKDNKVPKPQKSTPIGCVLFRPGKTMGIAIQSGKTKN